MRRIKKTLIGVGILLLAFFISTAVQVEDWSRDLTTNFAATSTEAEDPLLRTLFLSASQDRVAKAVADFAKKASRWNVEKTEENSGSIVMTMTHATRIIGYIDDVQVFIERHQTGSQVDLSSQSRVGKGDLGQNPRNIREITGMLQSSFEPFE